MFRIDKNANRLIRLETASLSELGFKEREHLQEWLAHEHGVFGEDLLIIQKEFNGFDDTRERLDLLALDKSGSLVVVENKRDNSGRDVVWQGLKYISYCSTLSKSNIVEIYQSYLDKTGEGGSALQKICDFMEADDLDEVRINSGDRQRLFLVASYFPKEVTSTVLWLLRRGIDLKCFKATLHRDNSTIYLDFEQEIPLPEAEELMIRMSSKEQEDSSSDQAEAHRHLLRPVFWRQLLDAMAEKKFDLYGGVSPSKENWLNAGAGLSGTKYTLVFGKREVRVEFGISGDFREQTKSMFDHLRTRKEVIEKVFGEPLGWRRMDDKDTSLLVLSKQVDGYQKDNWPQMIEWLIDRMQRLESAISPEIPGLREVKNRLRE
jgi:hypothetical protein